MSKICKLTGKKPLKANNVSHSKRRTRRWQMPNLQKKRLMNPATGRLEAVTLSTRGIKIVKRWLKEGKTFDLKDYK